MTNNMFILKFVHSYNNQNEMRLPLGDISNTVISNLTDVIIVDNGNIIKSKKAERMILFIRPDREKLKKLYDRLKKNDISSVIICKDNKEVEFSMSWESLMDGTNKYQKTEVIGDTIKVVITSY